MQGPIQSAVREDGNLAFSVVSRSRFLGEDGEDAMVFTRVMEGMKNFS
jgi:hypothetical protein